MAEISDFFAEWPEKYDEWFETPIGRLVREYEGRVLREMVCPGPDEEILDVGCGTGVFTSDLLDAGSRVTGLEICLPMLLRAGKKAAGRPLLMVRGDMRRLPFAENSFDKTVSVTAIEFLAEDARGAVADMFRVTRPGGLIVVASLNSLSPWATRRKAAKDHPIFTHTRFRSPAEMKELAPFPASIKTAVHFQKHEDPERAKQIEGDGNARGLDTGAFLAVRWKKPAA
ncbi:MAG: class I SAM-dependent methyltransferase [Syntrophobacteraceae bacterium]|jgi:ubiquinone/menaquinone biosynthesis C-methylase UbiE